MDSEAGSPRPGLPLEIAVSKVVTIMDCDKCHNLLSDLIDDELSGDERRRLDSHIEECAVCNHTHADLDRIIRVARQNNEDSFAPQDSGALWLRIRESIESDVTWARDAHIPPAPTSAGWWSRVWNRSWEFTAPQVAGGFASLTGIAVLGALFGMSALRDSSVTGVAEQGSEQPVISSFGSSSFAPVTVATTATMNRTSYEEHVRRRQADIDYWRQRVEENKNRLPPRMRESLERTIVSLDQDVSLSLASRVCSCAGCSRFPPRHSTGFAKRMTRAPMCVSSWKIFPAPCASRCGISRA